MDPVLVALGVAVGLLAVAVIGLLVALLGSRRSLAMALASRAAALEAHQNVAELAAKSERLRIVREMHDVIAHSLAIMIAQADGGSYVTGDADAAKRAFTTIAETGRGALADTRRILGVLKHGDESVPELAPSPETGLDDLAARYRSAGLDISLIRVGDVRPLTAGCRTALHRIAQEALTNVLKHAGDDARVIVTENWLDDAVTLTVTSSGGTKATATDPFTGKTLAGAGMGLIGMRERAELLGGTLVAGPFDDGFRVRAELPYGLEE